MMTEDAADDQAPTWTPPPLWTVPREWPGARCFIICSGESIKRQREQIRQLRGRVIAVKHGVYARPDADVLFLSGERTAEVAPALIAAFTGRYVVVRGKGIPSLPPHVLRVTRTKDHDHLSSDPTHVGGYDSGTSAIHLAALFGATEIVVLGMDMTGGHFVKDHPMPFPPELHFRRHMGPLEALAQDAARKGIRIVNCSPISRVEAFERQPLDAFLEGAIC